MNILHIFQDEKFIDFIVNLFSSSADISNRFVGLEVKATSLPTSFVDNPSACCVKTSWLNSGEMHEALAWCDCLIVHYLTARSARIIQAAPRDVTVVWSGWGRDYYDLLSLSQASLFEPNTRKMTENASPLKQAYNMAEMRLRLKVRRMRLLPSVRRVDLFSAPLPSDYDLVREGLSKDFTSRYVQLNYGNVSDLFDRGPEGVTGSNILLGNSATAENNHADILPVLARLDLGQRKVIVPLSYGDAAYRDRIIEMGKALLGDAFHPLTRFMPLDAYNNILSSCNTAIMNHRRQQALGNIGTLLQKGVRVYLNSAGPVYGFLTGLGATVFSVSDLATVRAIPENPLPEQHKQRNRDAIARFWGDTVVRQNLETFLSVVKAHRG